MSSEDNVYNRIVIDLEGMHPTYARQAILLANQIQSWFGWRHIAFVLEIVESGSYLAEDRSSTWTVGEARKFATKAEAVSWCGDRHITRGGLAIERSLVEKDGEQKTVDLHDGDHVLLEVKPPSEWLQHIREFTERMTASGLIEDHEGHGDIGAVVLSVHSVERLPTPDTDAD
jgi:hypothetical protein